MSKIVDEIQLEHEASEIRRHNLSSLLDIEVKYDLRLLNEKLMICKNYIDDYLFEQFFSYNIGKCFCYELFSRNICMEDHIDMFHNKVEINFYEIVVDKFVADKYNIHHIPALDIRFKWDIKTLFVTVEYKHYKNLTSTQLVNILNNEFSNDILHYMKTIKLR